MSQPTQTIETIADPTRAHQRTGGPRPVRVHVWEPGGPGPHPLVLLSHGTGGGAADLSWLALSLRDAGFVVAGVDHHGNSWADEYLAEGFAFVWERPRDLSLALDHVLATREIDPRRIGAAGFSLGGYSVIALLGGRLAGEAVRAVITGAVPTPPLPEFPDLIPRLRESWSDDALLARAADATSSLRDERVRAGFAIAPSIGILADGASLAEISVPLDVRWGDIDEEAAPAENAHRYVREIPTASGKSVGADIGHYVFIDDRDDPHGIRPRVAADAVAFFRRELGA